MLPNHIITHAPPAGYFRDKLKVDKDGDDNGGYKNGGYLTVNEKVG